MYQAEPDAALDGRCAYVPRGKLLGGSGAINAMVYVRGQPHDYDDWRALGNPGWSFEDVRPLFERAERQIHLTDISSFAHPLTHAYLESSRRVGLPVSDNFNGSQMEGVGIYRFTTRGGTRDSTARSYLRPALRAAGNSLQLRLHAHTLRVLVEQRRAVGVQYRHRGRTLEARASRGVILCAGSVNTPQLLQLSGSGSGAPAGTARHPAAQQHARGRTQPAGSSGGIVFLSLDHPHTQQRAPSLARQAARHCALPDDAQRTAVDERQPGRRLRAQ